MPSPLLRGRTRRKPVEPRPWMSRRRPRLAPRSSRRILAAGASDKAATGAAPSTGVATGGGD
eukprot:8221087-Lingulodinium_polyedra.AAC.1